MSQIDHAVLKKELTAAAKTSLESIKYLRKRDYFAIIASCLHSIDRLR